MHEWALAEAIVEAVWRSLSDKPVKQLSFLEVRIGELQSADREILRFALRELFEDRGIVVNRLRLKGEEAVLRCRSCGSLWKLSDLKVPDDAREAIHFIPEVFKVFISCKRCGSQDLEVVKGRGVYISSLKL